MTLAEAVQFIQPAFTAKFPNGTWADLGAGTGVFTLALRALMTDGQIIALDKSPHALWSLPRSGTIPITVEEGDFRYPLSLPNLDGMILANALHYVETPVPVLAQLLGYLKPGGQLLLIEYDTTRPNPPWVPFPISQKQATQFFDTLGMTEIQEFARRPSQYGNPYLYGISVRKSEVE